MNKILQNPRTIAACQQLFINIYNTMKRKKTLRKLKNTKLGKFFELNGLVL
jgi:hypothetical protein